MSQAKKQQQASLQGLERQLKAKRQSDGTKFALNRSRYWFCLGTARSHGIEFLNLMGDMWFQHRPGKTGIQKFRFSPSKPPDLLLLFLILHTRMYQPILESVFGNRLVCFDEYLRNYFEIMGTLMHKIWQSIGKDTHNIPFFSKAHGKDLTDISSTSTSSASQQKKQSSASQQQNQTARKRKTEELLQLFTPENLHMVPDEFIQMMQGCMNFLAFASIGIVFENKSTQPPQVTKLLRLNAASRFMLEIEKVQEVLPGNVAAIAIPDGVHDPSRWKMTLFDRETVQTASAYIEMKKREMDFNVEFNNLVLANTLFDRTSVNVPEPVRMWSDRAITMTKCQGESMSKLLIKIQSMDLLTVIKPADNFCKCFRKCYRDLITTYAQWSASSRDDIIVHTDPTEGNIVMNQTEKGIEQDRTDPLPPDVSNTDVLARLLPQSITLPNKAYLIDWGDACTIPLSDPIMNDMFKAFVDRLKTIQNPEFNEKTVIADLVKQFNDLKKRSGGLFNEGHEMVRQYLLQAFRKHVNLFTSCMNGIGGIMYTIYTHLGTIYQALDQFLYVGFLRRDVCGAYYDYFARQIEIKHPGIEPKEINRLFVEEVHNTARDRDRLFRLYMFIDFSQPTTMDDEDDEY